MLETILISSTIMSFKCQAITTLNSNLFPREYFGYCSIGSKIWVFGGGSKNDPLDDLWIINIDESSPSMYAASIV